MTARDAAPAVLAALISAPPLPAEDAVLYEKKSPYNTIVVTENAEGIRTLRFERNGLRQSVVKPGDPDHVELAYPPGMMAALGLCAQPKRMLVVGLGGGTLPGLLHKHCPAAAIDVVDIDPDVVSVARDFFGFREDERLRAHVADGRTFIEQCAAPYDIILLDAFGANEIPYALVTAEFLGAVRRALAPGGVVAGNVFSRGSNPLYDAMIRTYQEVFRHVYVLDLRGATNKIILALPRQDGPTPEAFAQSAGAASRALGFPFDLADTVAYGCRRIEDKSPDARVLRDADRPAHPAP